MKLTRRAALKSLLGGVAIIATPGGILLAKAEPVRRYWQVGATLSAAGTGGGLTPIEGQPGLFRDNSSGNIINMRDFSESDKYDTVTIPNRSNPSPGANTLFQAQATCEKKWTTSFVKLPPGVHEDKGLTFQTPGKRVEPDMTVREATEAALKESYELHVQREKGWVLGA